MSILCLVLILVLSLQLDKQKKALESLNQKLSEMVEKSDSE